MSTLPRGCASHSVLVTDIPCLDGQDAAAPKKAVKKVKTLTHSISKIRAPGQSDFKVNLAPCLGLLAQNNFVCAL